MTLFWYCFYLHSVCWGPSLFWYDSAQPALLKAMAVLVCVIIFDFIDPTVEQDLSCHFKPSKDMVVVLCCFQDLSITSIKSWFIWLKKHKKNLLSARKHAGTFTCRSVWNALWFASKAEGWAGIPLGFKPCMINHHYSQPLRMLAPFWVNIWKCYWDLCRAAPVPLKIVLQFCCWWQTFRLPIQIFEEEEYSKTLLWSFFFSFFFTY